MRIALLDVVQQRGHCRAQGRIQFDGRPGRWQRSADLHDDRNLVAAQVLRMTFGPNTLRSPDDHRDDRHLSLQRHPGRSALELLEFETSADGGLRIDAYQFTGLQCTHRLGVGGRTGLTVHRYGPGVLDHKVDDCDLLHLGLGHQSDPAPSPAAGQAHREEIDVAGVVGRHHRSATGGQVLHTLIGDRDTRSLGRNKGAELQGAINQFHRHSACRAGAALLAAGGPFGQFRGLEFGGFGGCGRGAAESVRHPELIGRIRTVSVLNGFE